MAAPHRADFKFTAEQRRALFHSQKPERTDIGNFAAGNSAPVVLHFHNNSPAGLFQMHGHVRRARVPHDVRQRFLKNPEKSRRNLLVQFRIVQLRVNVASDSGARLKFVRLPFQRGGKAEVIQNARAQFRCDSPHRLNRRIHLRGKLFRFFDQRSDFFRQTPDQPG